MQHSSIKEYLKDNITVMLGLALIHLKSFILMPIIIKILGVTAYGGYILLVSTLGIFYAFSSLGVGISAKRYLPASKVEGNRSNLFYPQFTFGLITVLVLALLSFTFADEIRFYLFDNKIDYAPFIIPAYLITFFLYSQGIDYFRYTSRIPHMTLGVTIHPFIHISLVLLFFFILNIISLDILILSEILAACIIGIICMMVIVKEIGFRMVLLRPSALWTEIKIGIPLVLDNVIGVLLAAGDRYVIAFLLSLTAVGYYTPGYMLGSVAMLIPKAIGTVIPQLMSKAVDRGEKHEAERIAEYTIKLFFTLSIPIVFGSIIVAPYILTLLTNASVAEQASIIVAIIALASVFSGLNTIFSTMLFVNLETSYLFRVNLLAVIVNIIANIVLISIYQNIIMAAITTLGSYLLAFLILKTKISKLWNISYNPIYIVKVVAASTIMFVWLWLFDNLVNVGNSIVYLSILIISAMVVYILSLFLVGTFSQKELALVKQLISKK